MARGVTFRYEDLDFRILKGVYEPSDDSLMLLKAALDRNPNHALEIGTGCGLIAIILSRRGCPFVVGTDVSLKAINCARLNANRLAPRVQLVLSNLFSGIKGLFDLILFNPPYLPVKRGGMEEVCWAGGMGGMELIEGFIRGVPHHLTEGGCALLVHSSLNDPESSKALSQDKNLRLRVVAEEAFFFERLYVVELSM